MTDRLYYTDPTLATFEGVVRTCTPDGGRCRVTLDRTAFYPSSGGQPFDTGRLGGRRVVDVVDGQDDEIEHVVDGPLSPGDAVVGEIDWDRRFDHMQQHTGQHLLSAAFERLVGVRTESFHLGTDTSTIDLAREVSVAELGQAERLASQVVWENRPVHVRFASDEEAAALPLRKELSRTGQIRLIEIPDFDLSACGGTHVADTGRVGVIAVSGSERFRGGSRITFVCGLRALRAHGRLRDIAALASRRLSVGPDDLDAAIVRLQEDLRVQSRTLRRLHEELAAFRAADWRESAETVGRYRSVIRNEPGVGAGDVKAMATSVVSESGFVAVFVGGGTPAPVVIARSADVALDAGDLIRRMTAALGGRGGGRPEVAQGGIPAAAEAIIEFVRQLLSGVSE